ncbi:leucine-rich repeat, cysteine-containing subtype protein [Tanacetum coccineum]
MAPTKLGEKVLDLVIPYIHNVDDRSSVSLVSRPPPIFYNRDGYVIRITPWIQQLALEFRSLKELHIRNLVVLDEERGKDLRSLKISKCEGYSTDGLRHVSKYCNQLRTLCLKYSYPIEMDDGLWLHELALNTKVLEKFKFKNTDIYHTHAEDLTLLAKNCCNSLISLKIGECYLSELAYAFRYAVRLEHFGGYICDEESDLVGFQFPQNTRSLSTTDFPVTLDSIRLPFLNHTRKLKLEFLELYAECGCLLLKQCPNLEVLYNEDVCGDGGLQVIGKFCKKLRKLTHRGRVTHVGLIALAKGCINLESFKESASFPYMRGKLERLRIIHLWHGGLTDVGLEYIGKYGVNLRSLALECEGNSNTGLMKLSNAGLVKLSEGCPKLRKLELTNCGFSEQVATGFMFNIPSLRYVGNDDFPSGLALTRPEFEH